MFQGMCLHHAKRHFIFDYRFMERIIDLSQLQDRVVCRCIIKKIAGVMRLRSDITNLSAVMGCVFQFLKPYEPVYDRNARS